MIYFDNAATTCVFPEVVEAMQDAMQVTYGNPSAKHMKGIEAENKVKAAQELIAKTLRAKPKEILFTSGGTESNNTAISGTAMANRRKGKHIITTKVEHASVYEPMYHLEEEGYEVIGVTMGMWQEPGETEGCGNLSAVKDASHVAEKLGIEFHVLDFRKEFRENVVDYFINSYEGGMTPNPCIACNRHVKWAALLDYANKIGADYIATGHYARIEKHPVTGRYSIKASVTATKDQTYALYRLTQEQLEHTLMPVGNYSKDQIREMAEKIGLQVANKPDSQDICFVPDGDYASFIEENADAPIRQGNFVTPDGKILGKHKGIIHYTVGQRKGLGLALGYPAFVLEIRPETDEVVIGTYEESLTHTLRANELNFMSVEDLTEPMRVFAKIRYNHKGAWCIVEKTGEDEITCTFDEPIRAVTPGQAVVLYDGEYVLGGGTIL